MIAADRRTKVFPVWLPERQSRGEPVVRRRSRLHPMAGAMVVAVLLTLPALLYVSQLTHRAEAGYTILRLQRELTHLRAEQARLSSLASVLKSPQRIEHYATTELGMAPPRHHQLAAITAGPAIAGVEVPAERRGILHQLTAWFGRSEAEARERPR